MLDIVTMVFESTSMRYETLVARFWLRVRRVPQSSCRRQSRDKRQELWGREWVALFLTNRLLETIQQNLKFKAIKFVRFPNGFNKVVIELLVVQFWTEIILVISNRTRAARSFDFEITRMISDQIALHSVQLPL